MYDAYLAIYQFAISMSGEELSPSALEGNDKEFLVFIEKRISRRYLWTYWFIYLIIYGMLIVPQIVLLPADSDLGHQPDSMNFLSMIIGFLVFAIFHGYIFYSRVIKYHKLNPTKVIRYGKLSYEEIYPKQLRKKLWLWNIFPFAYFTFAIVPIIARIQHLVETKMLSRVILQKSESGEDINPRLSQYTLIKNLIQKKIHSYNETKADPLGTLKRLFERRITEISTDVQRISIILSSIGIAVSLMAIMVKDPITELLEKPNAIILYIMFSFIAIIVGIIIYFISQLQIQVGKRRNISIVLDAIDIMRPDYEHENGAAQRRRGSP
jgi:hypothetical protein